MQKNAKSGCIFPGCVFLLGKKTKWLVSEAHGVVRVRLLPWPSCLPDEQNHGFVTDSDPHGSKSGSEGIPWQLFSRRISWEEPNPTEMREMGRTNRGFPEKSAKSRPNPPKPVPNPRIFRSRSATKKAAGGYARIQIWSHEGPN